VACSEAVSFDALGIRYLLRWVWKGVGLLYARPVEDAGELYGLPLDRFVSERDALAKALRAAGKRDEAAEVAKLRKPSVSAWAVNQLVRTQGAAVGELLAAGDALRAAHEAALSGAGDGHALREASDRERAAVDGLVGTARGLLTSQGHELSPATIERVGETLRAAAREEGAREQVSAGCLVRELRSSGLGVAAGAGRAPRAKKASTKKPDAKKAEGDKRAAAARKEAEALEARTRRVAARAARAVETAEERRERAASALAAAEDALAGAREEAAAAADLHRRAQEALDARPGS
jgi:hypothetical protein